MHGVQLQSILVFKLTMEWTYNVMNVIIVKKKKNPTNKSEK